MSDTAVTPTPSNRSNTSLFVLIASFLIPAILAYGYFFLGDKPGVKSNGELIIPIVDIHTLKITKEDGSEFTEEELTPHWRLTYFAGASCDERCQKSLYLMRQINISMGKYQDRVNYGIIHLETPDAAFKELIEKEHKAAGNLYTKTENVTAILPLEKNPNELRSIYLVDPLGNIMMHFPEGLDPKLIRKDFNKLLKISRLR